MLLQLATEAILDIEKKFESRREADIFLCSLGNVPVAQRIERQPPELKASGSSPDRHILSLVLIHLSISPSIPGDTLSARFLGFSD